MTLYTKAQQRKLLENFAVNEAARNKDGNTQDFKPVVKLFNPMGAQTWLLSEMDQYDIAFGLCDLGMGYPEMGYVSLDELRALRLPLGLGIERDLHFTANKTLLEYYREAKQAGRIVA